MLLTLSLVFTLAIDSVSLFSPLRVQGAAFRPPCAPIGEFRPFVGPENVRGRLLNDPVGKIVSHSDRSGVGVRVVVMAISGAAIGRATPQGARLERVVASGGHDLGPVVARHPGDRREAAQHIGDLVSGAGTGSLAI